MRCWHSLVRCSVVMLLVFVVLGGFGGGVAFGEVVFEIELGSGYVEGDPDDAGDSIGSGRYTEGFLEVAGDKFESTIYELPTFHWSDVFVVIPLATVHPIFFYNDIAYLRIQHMGGAR